MARPRNGRGGSRTPSNPAPVSGPSALSQRTDGGAGQPVRSFPAEYHGQRAALEGLQGAAPMAGAPSPGTPTPAPTPPPGMIEQGIFGPSERPGEPITEGLDFGQVGAAEPSMIPDDPDEVLRAIYEAFPHPAIARLIRE